jgi:hypothetical protein
LPFSYFSLLSQVVKVSDDVLAFRRWVASSSTEPFSDADAEQSDDGPAAASANSQESAEPISGPAKSRAVANNEDQSLSEDPLLPSHITPTPSCNVLPRDLPSKVFGGKPSRADADAESVADSGVARDNDNMSGVSTSTGSEASSSSSTPSSNAETVGSNRGGGKGRGKKLSRFF